MNYLLLILPLFISACSSLTKKSVCDYSGGQPNARYVVVGSCLKTKGVIQEIRWVESKQIGSSIEQGHFVIDTVPYKAGEDL